MARKARAARREVLADPVYHSQIVTRFVNTIMVDGKKSVAESIVYGCFEQISQKSGQDPLELFRKALDNVRPAVEVKSRRVGGSTYQVPVEVRPERRTSLGMRWIIDYASSRSGRSMREKLAAEIMDAAANRGNAVKKREDTHKMADANKAFSHYRW
ncbi:MAG: 30S ribosomal protein S7 [Deltaproteobacteria bacterium]|nr:30S ribosomal protein S7 [Deltaproteobacteria bacterium]